MLGNRNIMKNFFLCSLTTKFGLQNLGLILVFHSRNKPNYDNITKTIQMRMEKMELFRRNMYTPVKAVVLNL